MDPIASIAASGIRARMESLDLLANNIANASTGGYKAQPDIYRPVVPAPNIQISSDGAVTQDGTIIGQLEIADFTSTAGLSKQGGNYFRVIDPSITPSPASSTTVAQGQLESSNTGSAESAVRLVSVM